MKRTSAFTLIELLVVIAIIAILAGIALPVFNKVQERSRATNCAANLRQIGIGLQAYLNDHDDQFFPKEGKDDKSWPRMLNPKYIPGWKVFRSPFDKVTADRFDTEVVAKMPPVSYGINEFCFAVNASKFTAPSQLMVMGAAVEDNDDLIFLGTSDSHPKLKQHDPNKNQGNNGAVKRGTHFNRSQLNILFADTHVESMKYLEFSQVDSDEGKKRWYPEGEKPDDNSGGTKP